MGVSSALVVDAVVHFRDAHLYDANKGSLLSQGALFRIQAVVALGLVLLVWVWASRTTWVAALLLTGSAVAAVVLYRYVDVGPLAGLPNMYEPSWGPPGKLLSAFAEGTGALLALGGLAWTLRAAEPRPSA
ncbi:MAG TPA: hypothetical protein VNG13_11435 [Mycobacteriales bacterium]|nr:hypothetical protein [Mycobacteriales bacterium]